MKFTYHWLKEYCPIEISPKELADLLTLHGIKVEAIYPFEDDTVFELEITANRPDLLGILGIAREVALLTGVRLKLPRLNSESLKLRSKMQNFVEVETPDLCPLYIGRIIRGVQVKDSPNWLKKKLEAIGLRSVNNIVDITNFVLYETGQPLHTFDLDRLNEKRLVVRAARPGEMIRAINDNEYQLTPEMLVIADAKVPVAIAGIMGGKNTEITSTTSNILLESAIFQPTSIRRTSRNLALSSDSSYRFERGIDPAGVELASRRASTLIRQLAGGTLVARQEVNFIRPKIRRIILRLEKIPATLGIQIDKSDIKRILKGLGFIINKEYKGLIEVIVPSFRLDITREIDIIEELARIVGYGNIPNLPPVLSPNLFLGYKLDNVTSLVRKLLIGLGYQEVLTNSFLEQKYLKDFSFWSIQEPLGVLNPKGEVDRYLRNSLIPGLLLVQRLNQGYSEEADKLSLFEISKAYWRKIKDQTSEPEEKFLLGMLDINGFYSLKGTFNKIFSEVKIAVETQPLHTSYITNGEGLKFICQHKPLGWLGNLSPNLINKYEIRKPPAVGELDFELLAQLANMDKVYREFSRYPAIIRDIAMVFDRTTTWQEIEAVIRQDMPEFLESIKFFDLYEGSNIPAGKKSLAFSLIFRSRTRTLTHSEVDEVIKQIIERLSKRFNASLRS